MVEYIRTGDFLGKLRLLSTTNHDSITLFHHTPQLIVPLLQTFEASSQLNQFTQHSYSCSVCLTLLHGSKCLQLNCEHIFCRSCLEDFWKLRIKEGDVARVGCPDPECVKKATEASEEEVAKIVTEAELVRWRWLREKRAYEKDPTVVYCPIAGCQTPVPKPQDVDANSDIGWNRLRQCSRCKFNFCALCKRTWHGPLESCPLNPPEDSGKERFFAQNHSKMSASKMLKLRRAEKASLQYLQFATTSCPGCHCYVEKTAGCNHMVCFKCSQHFCFRCGIAIPDKSYDHFSTLCFKLDANGQRIANDKSWNGHGFPQ
ncbi:hypothetical protein CPB83DRAFT_655759 [Crepidotus variabilis]|uniref:RBR-type E3 ubiquitin transferase n=1 Tax=Crepidotus variabilis TaxID=179855 RepID=A0A9P6E730_9AGAR|nr:hypothetical protein CPB83DRAFT_655759 [Crepidotus variabilis]